LEGGLGTHYLFYETSVGSKLTLRGPQGVFVLPKPIDRDLFLICTGTGVAPFRSMTHHIKNHGIPHQKIYLIFGCRKTSDCLYSNELKSLEEQLPDFEYVPTFSREQPGNYKTGYVHTVYEDICKNGNVENNPLNASPLKPAYFYLCGWKNMIDEAKQRILALGYDRKSIHQELYG
jgi:CDP-4-dehydro-6-deoxyglucose reductase